MKADYETSFPVSFEKLKSTGEIDAFITRYRQGRTNIGDKIADIDRLFKETTGLLAQLAERRAWYQKVLGSNPTFSHEAYYMPSSSRWRFEKKLRFLFKKVVIMYYHRKMKLM
jgi:hypothetical protein